MVMANLQSAIRKTRCPLGTRSLLEWNAKSYVAGKSLLALIERKELLCAKMYCGGYMQNIQSAMTTNGRALQRICSGKT